MKISHSLGAFLLLVSFAIAAATQPNIVFIMADDLGWRDLGCFGSTYHQTPNVDKLAARGVKFTNAYAANPLCSPTRSSVLTGLWPARTGITAPVCHVPEVILDKQLTKGSPKQRVLVAQSVTRLKTDYVTLPKLLREAGYRTGHFGKWHLGPEPYSPLQQGFDVDWPHHPGPGPAGSYVAPWAFNAKLNITSTPGEHIEDRLSQEAAKFIRENKDRPFYLNYWQFSVHAPYDAKTSLIDKYRKLADPKNPQHNPLYAAMVESLDDGVGRVIAALEEAGVMDRTIIVYFSDNGGVNWQAMKKEGKGGPSGPSAEFAEIPPTDNTPLRGGKASCYEGGTREPCIVIWPGVTKPGTTNQTVIQSIDWMPTLLEIAGVKLPSAVKVDGVSLVPLLKGGKLDRPAIFCHFPHDTPASGQHPATYVRRGDWKLHRIYAGNDDGADRLELYNLNEDLGEAHDVAAQHPEMVRELNALIGGFLAETQAVVPKLNPNYKPGATDDGKARGKTGGKKAVDALDGWVQRSCAAAAKQGILTVNGKGADPFLGLPANQYSGPTSLHFRARSAAGGNAKVEWIPSAKDGAKSPAHSVTYQLAPGELQEITVNLPATGPLGILRLYLPAQNVPVEVDWIELKNGNKTRRWDF